jgi:hypothetical protein
MVLLVPAIPAWVSVMAVAPTCQGLVVEVTVAIFEISGTVTLAGVRSLE